MVPLVQSKVECQQDNPSHPWRQADNINTLVLYAVPHRDVVRREHPLPKLQRRHTVSKHLKSRTAVLVDERFHCLPSVLRAPALPRLEQVLARQLRQSIFAAEGWSAQVNECLAA